MDCSPFTPGSLSYLIIFAKQTYTLASTQALTRTSPQFAPRGVGAGGARAWVLRLPIHGVKIRQSQLIMDVISVDSHEFSRATIFVQFPNFAQGWYYYCSSCSRILARLKHRVLSKKLCLKSWVVETTILMGSGLRHSTPLSLGTDTRNKRRGPGLYSYLSFLVAPHHNYDRDSISIIQ